MSKVTALRPSEVTPVYVEPAAETAAMHLRQAASIVDLMATLANQSVDDPCSRLQELDVRTLSNALDATKRHIEAAEELVEDWPRVPTAEVVSRAPVPTAGYSEQTADRLRAYVASVGPMDGIEDVIDDERYQNGLALIERMAASTRGTDSPRTLSILQCADLVFFLHTTLPIDPANWWKDPKDAPSHLVGYTFVLNVIEDSLRVARRRG
jgi:hypothetical protein